ncbi:uncharacterized protein LOC107676187 [Sinocyclocheilus anshuiensis]|uniref:uncharacterized protein LOC107676187 n=1 Tax=Sinocyclocheilus anshuiensis TaxID=1608454 RepID=UPI0007B934FB|nr:PREDICTED: uncharacterized protein LOC107676187 [Sinocyclocheilus anshuiensis]
MHTTEFPLTSRLIPPSQGFPVQKGGESPLLKTSPASIPEPPAAARGWEPFQRLSSSHGVSPKELDKLARNIPTFTPNPAGGHDVHAYLKDIDFHLQTVANVTTRDRLYLLRITASREVRSFLDRQPETVEVDYQQLQQALIKEFSDPESEQGLITAMDLKQGRQETTQAYYNRLRQAYFGARNEPGMEQDFNFKILFLRNLHPTVSHHLGVLACPRTMSTQQLRDLAQEAYAKQRTASENTGKKTTIYPVTNQSSELALEGAEPSHNDKPVNTMSRSFPTSREQHGHGGARPKHQYECPERSWDRSQPPLNRRGGATWEAKRRPKGNRHSQTQAPSSDCQQQNPSQQLRDLAQEAYAKQRTASENTGKKTTIYPVTNQSSELALEGTEPSHNDKPVNTMSRSFRGRCSTQPAKRPSSQPHPRLLPTFTRMWGTGPYFGSHTPR